MAEYSLAKAYCIPNVGPSYAAARLRIDNPAIKYMMM